MAFCTKCGKQNPDKAKFCTGCGAALSAIVLIQTEKKKNTIILITVTALLVLGAASYFIFFNKKRKSDTHITNINPANENRDSSAIHSGSETPITTPNHVLSYTDINGLLVYLSDCFIIINGSYAEEVNAINAVNSMKASGNNNAGYFWRPDYPSINDKYLYSTFIGPYQTYTECEKDLRIFKQSNAYWYGIKISYDNTRIEIR